MPQGKVGSNFMRLVCIFQINSKVVLKLIKGDQDAGLEVNFTEGDLNEELGLLYDFSLVLHCKIGM